MSLSGTSTYAQVCAAYDDNASYEEEGSATKCAAFITACRILLHRRPIKSMRGGQGSSSEVDFDSQVLAAELKEARRWLVMNSAAAQASRVTHPSFEFFRD